MRRYLTLRCCVRALGSARLIGVGVFDEETLTRAR